jgi:hypothetical protein
MTVVKHLFFIFLAYALASVVTGYVVDISLLTYGGVAGDDARKDTLGFGLFVAFFVTYFAACPAAATVAVGEFFAIRRWWYYALAGSAIGLGLGTMFKPPEFYPWLGLGFGPVSGLIYWGVAGRHAGLAEPKARRILALGVAGLAGLFFVFTWIAFLGAFF